MQSNKIWYAINKLNVILIYTYNATSITLFILQKRPQELDNLQKATNEALFLRMHSQLRAHSFIEEAGKWQSASIFWLWFSTVIMTLKQAGGLATAFLGTGTSASSHS